MAYTLSTNLRLRLDSNLTANARYNLNRLDLLGSTFVSDSTDTLRIRSAGDIVVEPESADIGGTGSGGTVTIGTSSHSTTAVNIYTSALKTTSPLYLLDQATGGTRYLQLHYKSDSSGSVDTGNDRLLYIDLQGANRDLILGGSYTQTGGSLTLTLSGSTSLTLPTAGTVATLAGSETLTNKVISAATNTITGITNSNLSGSAGITYSNLNLTGSILGSDISASAAIPYSKLSLTGGVVNADISSSAAIARNKIAAGSASHVIINDGSGNLSSEAYLAISRGGTGAISANAGLNNLLPTQVGNSGRVLSTDGSNTSWVSTGTGSVTSVDMTVPSFLSVSGNPITTTGTLAVALATQAANRVFSGPSTGADATPTFRALVVADLPGSIPDSKLSTISTAGKVSGSAITSGDISTSGSFTTTNANGYFVNYLAQTARLQTDASGAQLDSSGNMLLRTNGTTTAITISTGQVTTFAQPPIISTFSSAGIVHNNASGVLSSSTIVNTDVDASAAISLSKLAAVTASRALASDASGYVSATAVTSTELGYLSGVTSAIQTQLNTITGGKVTATWAALDGTSKSVTHNLATTDISVTLYNIDSGEEIWVDTITRTSANAIAMTSNQAPTGSGWKVIIRR